MAKIRFRRDTAANWTSVNPVLDAGEIGIETDTLKAKLGDGTTAWNNLAYFKDVTFTGNYETDLANVKAAMHSHSNKTVLDAITDAGSGQIISSTERQDIADNKAARHTHSNKDVLDVLINTGDGSAYLANDGTYKVISGSGGATTFDDLADTPSTKIAGKYVQVSADGQSLVYADGSGPVNIDGIVTVNDIFALQNYTGYQDGDVVYMSGYWPDGEDQGMGAGFFKYDANQSHTFLGANILDNGIFVKPVDNTGTTGCWVRICNHKEINPFWFGAIGREFYYYDNASAPYRPASNHFTTLSDLNAHYFDQTLTLDDEIDTCAWIQALWSNEVRHRSYNTGFDYWNLETSININLPHDRYFYISKQIHFRAQYSLNIKFNGSYFVATQNFTPGSLEDPSPIIWIYGETRKKEPITLIDDPTKTYLEARTAWGLIEGIRIRSEYSDPNVTGRIGKAGGIIGIECTGGSNRTIRNCYIKGPRIALLFTGTHMLEYIHDNYFNAEMDCIYMSQYYGDFTTSVYVRYNEFANFGRYAIYAYLGGTGIDCAFEYNDIEAQLNPGDGYVNDNSWFVCGIKSPFCISNGNNINIKGIRQESITASAVQLHLNDGSYYIEGNGGLSSIYAGGNTGTTQAYQDFLRTNHFCIIDPQRNYLPKTETNHPSGSVSMTIKGLEYFSKIYTDKQNWTNPIAQTLHNIVFIDMYNVPKLYQLKTMPVDGTVYLPDPFDNPDAYEEYPSGSSFWDSKGYGYVFYGKTKIEVGTTKVGPQGDVQQIAGLKIFNDKYSIQNGSSGLVKWDDGFGLQSTNDYLGKYPHYFAVRDSNGDFSFMLPFGRYSTIQTEFKPMNEVFSRGTFDIRPKQGSIVWNTDFVYDSYPVIGKVNILDNVYSASYPEWTANTSINQGDIVRKAGTNNTYIFKALNYGTTSNTEPVWNTGVKLITVDNDITWECVGYYYGEWAYIQPILNGISEQRPSNPPDGLQFFDKTLGKPIWWNGSTWVDANGTAV